MYRGNSEHVDYLTIPGAPILELMTVFKREYGEVDQALDVVLVGVNFSFWLISNGACFRSQD